MVREQDSLEVVATPSVGVEGKDIDRVLSTGGTKYSAWRAAGVGVVCLVVIVAAGLAILAAAGEL